MSSISTTNTFISSAITSIVPSATITSTTLTTTSIILLSGKSINNSAIKIKYIIMYADELTVTLLSGN